MKKLVIVGGSMGVGKSTVCAQLLRLCGSQEAPAVYLDGDWCWNMHPFHANEENKAMVLENIAALLRSFLKNSSFETVIFCWVLHEQPIFEQLMARLQGLSCEVYYFTLLCAPQVLQQRLQADVAAGRRQADGTPRSLARLPLYQKLSTCPIDTTGSEPGAVAAQIARYLQHPPWTLRPATAQDAPILAGLHAEGWQAGYAGILPGETLAAMGPGQWEERLRQKLAGGQLEGFIAYRGGRPAGCITFGAARDPGQAGKGEIASLYLAPWAMGAGLGRALMAWAGQGLRLMGYGEACLWVLRDNLAARGFYEHLGLWWDGGERALSIGPGSFAAYRYQWQLSPFFAAKG